MRVALVVHVFPSREHPYISEWAGCLVDAGVDLTIIAERADAVPGERAALPESVGRRTQLLGDIHRPLTTLRRSTRSGVRGLVRSWNSARGKQTPFRRRVRKALESWGVSGGRYDVVHFNAPQIAVRRFELKRLLGGKTIVSFRGQDFSYHPDRYDGLLRDADHLHFISEDLLRQAKARGYDGRKHTLIAPMVDTEFYSPPTTGRPPRVPPGPFTVFSAARLEWTKGWEFALMAVAILVQKGYDIRYEVAGDGSMREAIVFTVHDLGIADRVQFLGWLRSQECAGPPEVC